MRQSRPHRRKIAAAAPKYAARAPKFEPFNPRGCTKDVSWDATNWGPRVLGFVVALAGQGAVAMVPLAEGSIDPVVERHRTVAGVTVEMPELAALDCSGIRRVLARLDRSGYRGGGVLAPEHPDRPVFEYEDRLARALYFDCILRDSRSLPAETVFLRGFGID